MFRILVKKAPRWKERGLKLDKKANFPAILKFF